MANTFFILDVRTHIIHVKKLSNKLVVGENAVGRSLDSRYKFYKIARLVHCLSSPKIKKKIV